VLLLFQEQINYGQQQEHDSSSSAAARPRHQEQKNYDQCSRSRNTVAAAESVGGGSCSCCFLANRVWQPASATCHQPTVFSFSGGCGSSRSAEAGDGKAVCSILPRLLASVGYDRTAAADFGELCKAFRQLGALKNEGNVFDALDKDCLLMLLGCGVSRDEELFLMSLGIIADLSAEARLLVEGLLLHLWMFDLCNLACGSGSMKCR